MHDKASLKAVSELSYLSILDIGNCYVNYISTSYDMHLSNVNFDLKWMQSRIVYSTSVDRHKNQDLLQLYFQYLTLKNNYESIFWLFNG